MKYILLVAFVVPLAAHAEAPPPCPRSMGVVEKTVGAPLIYLPADPATPELCRLVQRGGEVATFWFGTWRTDWPGAEQAHSALRQVYAGPPGTVVKFDTVAAPGYSWHETIRNDGFESLNIAGAVRPSMKVTHERAGFEGNTYHSIITLWKEIATGMTIYVNYNHVAGHPEPLISWDALSVVGGR